MSARRPPAAAAAAAGPRALVVSPSRGPGHFMSRRTVIVSLLGAAVVGVAAALVALMLIHTDDRSPQRAQAAVRAAHRRLDAVTRQMQAARGMSDVLVAGVAA